MSDDAAADAAKKKGGKGKKMIFILAGVLLLGGGGAAAGFYAAGTFSAKEEGPKEDPNKPKLVLKGEDPYVVGGVSPDGKAAPAEKSEEEEGAAPTKPAKPIDLPRPTDPSKYTVTYFQLPAPFTSNLADSDSFAQVSIAVSTYYDARVIQTVQNHELAIRSAILMMLAQEEEFALSTPQGKEKLQAALVKTINGVLKEKSGYGGVDNVYFTNFVIQ